MSVAHERLSNAQRTKCPAQLTSISYGWISARRTPGSRAATSMRARPCTRTVSGVAPSVSLSGSQRPFKREPAVRGSRVMPVISGAARFLDDRPRPQRVQRHVAAAHLEMKMRLPDAAAPAAPAQPLPGAHAKARRLGPQVLLVLPARNPAPPPRTRPAVRRTRRDARAAGCGHRARAGRSSGRSRRPRRARARSRHRAARRPAGRPPRRSQDRARREIVRDDTRRTSRSRSAAHRAAHAETERTAARQPPARRGRRAPRPRRARARASRARSRACKAQRVSRDWMPSARSLPGTTPRRVTGDLRICQSSAQFATRAAPPGAFGTGLAQRATRLGSLPHATSLAGEPSGNEVYQQARL